MSGDDFLSWFILLNVVVFGIVILLVVLGIAREAEHRQRLRREGETVKAHVSSVFADGGDGMSSPTYWANVQYSDGGEFVTTKVTISRAEYRSFREGTPVVVTYLPGQPRSVRRPAHLQSSRLSAEHDPPTFSPGDEERFRKLAR